MLASPELISRRDVSDSAINNEKMSRWLSSDLRALGYELSLREMRGDKSKDCQIQHDLHNQKLDKLYSITT